MSERGQSQKTEEATPKRLRDARRRGQVARSKDVVTAAMLVAACVFFWTGWRSQWGALEKIMSLSTTLFETPFQEALDRMLDVILEEFVSIVLPFALLLVAVGILANILQFGIAFSFDPVKPQLNRTNPITGIRRMFSLANLLEVVKTLLKVMAMALVVWAVFVYLTGSWVRTPWCGIRCVLPLLEKSAALVALGFTAIIVVLAVIDLVIQRRLFLRQQRMTTEQLRREQKDTMGDPQVVGRRREVNREAREDDLSKRIEQSTVLLHDHADRALCIQYVKDQTPLPVVTVIGTGGRARLMHARAIEANLPVVRNDRLAEILCTSGQIDQFIPSETIDAVARVLRSLDK